MPDTAREKNESDGSSLVMLNNVTKSYDGVHQVVRKLNLDIRRGEFLTLLGPSGSGKTTTLMMLAGFELPTSGQICLNGKDITQLHPSQRGLGVVFQNYALFPHMTVAQNLAFPLEMRNVSRPAITQQVNDALEMVGLSGLGSRFPETLSGGQKQRVALARALIFEPSLVLMDEPLGALDKRLRESLQSEIRQLQRRLGATVVFVTHDQTEALTMSDRIAVFNDGYVQQLGTAEDLYERPANAFVADFIGENNSLMGRIEAVQGREAKVALDGSGHLVGQLTDMLGEGDRVKVCFRPERGKLCDVRTANGNVVRGKLSDKVYHGDHVRLVVGHDDGSNIVLKILHDSQNASARLGDEIVITIDPSVVQVFKPAND